MKQSSSRYTHIAGIDPDSNKSGFALIDIKRREIRLFSLPILPLVQDRIDHLMDIQTVLGGRVLVVLENAYDTSHNWHYSTKDTRAVIAKKGFALGLCAQTYRIIEQAVKERGLDLIRQPPLLKCWRGTDRKITHTELLKQLDLHGLTLDADHLKRSNQEERDASLLALHHLGTIPQIIDLKTKI